MDEIEVLKKENDRLKRKLEKLENKSEQIQSFFFIEKEFHKLVLAYSDRQMQTYDETCIEALLCLLQDEEDEEEEEDEEDEEKEALRCLLQDEEEEEEEIA
jgi:hypothetical protein